MYEKLDKLRAELEKARQRRAEADAKVKQLEQRLQDADRQGSVTLCLSASSRTRRATAGSGVARSLPL